MMQIPVKDPKGKRTAGKAAGKGLAVTLALAVVLALCAGPSEAGATVVGPAQAGQTQLPARYDAREAGRTSPARDQGAWGSCWAFASLLACFPRRPGIFPRTTCFTIPILTSGKRWEATI